MQLRYLPVNLSSTCISKVWFSCIFQYQLLITLVQYIITTSRTCNKRVLSPLQFSELVTSIIIPLRLSAWLGTTLITLIWKSPNLYSAPCTTNTYWENKNKTTKVMALTKQNGPQNEGPLWTCRTGVSPW